MQRNAIEWLIAPCGVDAFFEKFWEREVLDVARKSRSYYTDLLSVRSIEELVCSRQKTSEIRLVKKGALLPRAAFCFDGTSPWRNDIDAERVIQLYADGATVIAERLHHSPGNIAALCRQLEMCLGVATQANAYLTPPGNAGFEVHYDSHDVFVLQCEGRKHWKIYDGGPYLPYGSESYSSQVTAVGAVAKEFVLEAGDMAYLPRGVLHSASTLDGMSLHITLGVVNPPTVKDVALELVRLASEREDFYRRAVVAGRMNNEEWQHTVRTVLHHLMGSGLDADVDKVKMRMLARVPARSFRTMNGVFDHLSGTVNVDGISVLRLIPGEARIECGENDVSLVLPRKKILLPAFIEDALRHIVRGDAFSIDDLPGPLDADGRLNLVRRLLIEGVIELVG